MAERVCRGCGARGHKLTQEHHRRVCDRADVVEGSMALDLPVVRPESRSEDFAFVRCPGCGTLVAVSVHLRDGDLAECDAGCCLAEFYVYGASG